MLCSSYLDWTFKRILAVTNDSLPLFVSHWNIHYTPQNNIYSKTRFSTFFFPFFCICLFIPKSVLAGSSAGKESDCNARDNSSIPWLGRSAGEGIDYQSSILRFPWWLRWWRIHLQCGTPGFDPWVGKIPWRREQLPTPVFWPGELHGQRSLAGYSPWGCRVGWLSDFHFTSSPNSGLDTGIPDPGLYTRIKGNFRILPCLKKAVDRIQGPGPKITKVILKHAVDGMDTLLCFKLHLRQLMVYEAKSHKLEVGEHNVIKKHTQIEIQIKNPN